MDDEQADHPTRAFPVPPQAPVPDEPGYQPQVSNPGGAAVQGVPLGPPAGQPYGPPPGTGQPAGPGWGAPSDYPYVGPAGPADSFGPSGPSDRQRDPHAHPGGAAVAAVWVLGIIGLICTIAGLSISEDGHNAWHFVHAWGAVAILGAVLVFAPAVAPTFTFALHRAWQTAVSGAALLALFWVLFVLPSVGNNTTLLATVGIAAGIGAAWIAPGRPSDPTRHNGPPPGHTW